MIFTLNKIEKFTSLIKDDFRTLGEAISWIMKRAVSFFSPDTMSSSFPLYKSVLQKNGHAIVKFKSIQRWINIFNLKLTKKFGASKLEPFRELLLFSKRLIWLCFSLTGLALG